MSIISSAALLQEKMNAQNLVNLQFQPQTPPDNITAVEVNAVLSTILALIENSIQSGYNKIDKIDITNVYQGSVANTLDIILSGYQPLINPINTAFNKNFGGGGNSIDIPRFDDPRFTDERIPVSNSVSTVKLQDNSVTDTKLADMPALTIKGNNTNALGNPLNLTVAQVRALLNIQDGAQANFTGKNSITVDSNEYQLVNDQLAPGNFYYYGTDSTGNKGYFTLESAINNYVSVLDGDDWGDQTADVETIVTNPDTSNTFSILSGNGLNPNPIAINGGALRDFINDVVSVSVAGDNWGTQVVELVAGGGLVGNGTTASRLGLNIISNSSLTGVGTAASNLAVDENWLSTYIADYITNNGADGWGDDVAFTSGLITGDGTSVNRIRLSNGSNIQNQLILWDFTLNQYKLVDAAGFSNELLTVNTLSPITGTGSVGNRVRLEDGAAAGNILQWVAGSPGSWQQINFTTLLNNTLTYGNGINKSVTNVVKLGGTLTENTNIITNGNNLDLTYTNLPSAFAGDPRISKFGYVLSSTHDEGRPLLGLSSGNYTDFNTSVADYKYVYGGIEYTDGNVFTIGALSKIGGIIIDESIFRLDSSEVSFSISGTSQTSFNISEDLGAVYDSTNDLGIRYTGFGESSVDNDSIAGADYSSLQFNSLVPKKYVDTKVGVYTETIPSLDSGRYVITHNLDSTVLQVQIKVFLYRTTYILIPASGINNLGRGETITTRIDDTNPNAITITCNFNTKRVAQVIVHKII